jgi:ApaG protein
MSAADADGQGGILRKGGIVPGAIAAHEPAAPRTHDLARVAARRAQSGGGRRLPSIGLIPHHGAMFTSEATTRGVRVSVVSEYAPGRSRPQHQEWFFLYTITITNVGSETVQLLSRHWIITNANGDVEEVRGPGVVGEQPILAPSESFTYTSGCPLATSFGTMEGTYQMIGGDSEPFDARVAPFTLSEPYTVH